MLEYRNISAGYGPRRVIDSLSAEFDRGRLSCIIGVNGCGKSTLLQTTIGILPISEGEILLDGASISQMDRRDIAKKAAYLPQHRSIPDMTVMQLVLHGRFPHVGYPRRYSAADRDIAREAMERVGISELAAEPLARLSGGARQAAYIAMALAQDTDYILLDEPTTYLDAAHQLSLMRMLRALADGGKGVIAVMHDLPLAFDFADEILLMRDGAIAASAPPAEMCGCGLVEQSFGVGVRRLPDGGGFYLSYSERSGYEKIS